LPKYIISTIHSDYRPEVRYLKDVRFISDSPLVLKGNFEVRDSVHLTHPIEHIAISEIAICVNQFERVLVAKLIESGYVAEWGELDFCKWNPSKLGDEGLMITHEEVTFKGVIEPGEFDGVLVVREERKSGRGNYHVDCFFEFADARHVGSVRICFVPSKSEVVNLDTLR